MKLKNILSAIILIFVLSLAVGFSAFVSEMSISNIVADIRVQKDVRITDIQLVDGNVISNSLDYSTDSVFGSLSFNSTDAVATYKMTITNFGNVDVYFNGYFIDELSGANFDCLEGCGYETIPALGNSHDMYFMVAYSDSASASFKLEIEIKSIFNVTFENLDFPDDTITEYDIYTKYIGSGYSKNNIKVYMDGVLVPSSGYEVDQGQLTVYDVTGDLVIKYVEPVAKLVSGSLDTIGSEVCIKDECFYIINNDGTTVSMLSKYNLYVGGTSDSSSNYNAYGSSATGIQNSAMIGWVAGSTKWQGTIEYSNSTQKGTNYSDYNGSVVQSHVNNYGSYLNSLGAYFNNIRLITTNELNSLGCVQSSNSCENAKSFVLNTSFWTGTAYDNNYVWFVVSDGNYDKYIDSNRKDRFGIRPVIEVSVDDINVSRLVKVVSGDYDTAGSEIAIGDEHFYVISSTEDSVTMLSKYNLYVGNSVDENGNVTPLSNPTGIQDSSARGLIFDSDDIMSTYPIIGTVAYSTGDAIYSGSIIEGHVNNYVTYLEKLGVTVNSSGLLLKDDIYALSEDGLGNDFPEWLKLTSFWLGDTIKGTALYFTSRGSWFEDFPSVDDVFGVRPVITISKEYF